MQNLSSTSYAVLGLISLRGPSTAYDIERGLGRLANEFWSVPHTQYYNELARLELAGLLSMSQDKEGRRRRVYRLTEAGKEALQEWLRQVTPESMQIQDIALLKLFLGELVEPEDILKLARQQIEIYRQRIATLEIMAEHFKDHPELARRLEPLQFGKKVYLAALEFWRELAEKLANTETGKPPQTKE